MEHLYDLVSRRAFEIFRERGGSDGNDLADWFRAESELFHAAHVDLIESPEALLVRAEAPGFAPHELEIGVEPRRLTLAGDRVPANFPSTHRTIYRDSCANRLFRVLDFPVEVDPASVRTALRDGALELVITKTMFSRTRPLGNKGGSIVRAADYRAWQQPFAGLEAIPNVK